MILLINNTCHTTIKMKPIDVKSNCCAEDNVESNEKDPQFEVSGYVRKSKYKNVFAKWYTPNLSEEFFVIKKIKNTFPWIYVISDLNGEDIIEFFYEKKLQKINQTEFKVNQKSKLRKSN